MRKRDIKIKRFTYQESNYKLLVSTAFMVQTGVQYNLLTPNWDRAYALLYGRWLSAQCL